MKHECGPHTPHSARSPAKPILQPELEKVDSRAPRYPWVAARREGLALGEYPQQLFFGKIK